MQQVHRLRSLLFGEKINNQYFYRYLKKFYHAVSQPLESLIFDEAKLSRLLENFRWLNDEVSFETLSNHTLGFSFSFQWSATAME